MPTLPSVNAPAPDDAASSIDDDGPRSVSSAEVEVRAATPSEDEAMEAFVRAHPGGSLFQRPSWRRAVSSTFGHEPRDLVALRQGELVGVLPLMRCRGLLGNSHLVSTPYGVLGGPLAVAPSVEATLVAKALDLARSERVGRLELRSAAPLELDGLQTSDR